MKIFKFGDAVVVQVEYLQIRSKKCHWIGLPGTIESIHYNDTSDEPRVCVALNSPIFFDGRTATKIDCYLDRVRPLRQYKTEVYNE